MRETLEDNKKIIKSIKTELITIEKIYDRKNQLRDLDGRIIDKLQALCNIVNDLLEETEEHEIKIAKLEGK